MSTAIYYFRGSASADGRTSEDHYININYYPRELYAKSGQTAPGYVILQKTDIPFIQSRASWPLIATSIIIVAVGAWLTVSPLANTLGFVPLPPLYWLLLAFMLPCYVILTQVVKTWFYRKYGE